MQNEDPNNNADEGGPSDSAAMRPTRGSHSRKPVYDQVSFTVQGWSSVNANASASSPASRSPSNKRGVSEVNDSSEEAQHPSRSGSDDHHASSVTVSYRLLEWTEDEERRIFDLKMAGRSWTAIGKIINEEGDRNDTTEYFAEKIFDRSSEAIANKRGVKEFNKYDFLRLKYHPREAIATPEPTGPPDEVYSNHDDAHIIRACKLAKGYANWDNAAQEYWQITGKRILPEYIRFRWTQLQGKTREI